MLAIAMLDYDGGLQTDPDDKIDDLVLRIPFDVGDRIFSRMTYEGRSGYASIDLSARVSCVENFYGSDCGTFCVERDDALGHYTCSSEGDLVCLAGYRNPLTKCTECVPAVGCCKLLLEF